LSHHHSLETSFLSDVYHSASSLSTQPGKKERKEERKKKGEEKKKKKKLSAIFKHHRSSSPAPDLTFFFLSSRRAPPSPAESPSPRARLGRGRSVVAVSRRDSGPSERRRERCESSPRTPNLTKLGENFSNPKWILESRVREELDLGVLLW